VEILSAKPQLNSGDLRTQLLLCLLVIVVAKDVLLWTTPDAAGGTVEGIVADVRSKMAFGVSTFTMCGYEITPDFSGLRPRVPNGTSPLVVEKIGAALRTAAPGLNQVPLIWSTGENGPSPEPTRAAWGRFLSNDTARSIFIASAVRVMQKQHYDGFNLDIERLGGKGSAGVDSVSFGRFLHEFAASVHAAGGRLSSDIDWCGDGHVWEKPHYDYMGMRCSDYAAGKLDSVVMMKTYLTNKRGQDLLSHFEEYIKPALKVLGPKLRVGMDCQVGGGDNITAAAMFARLDDFGVDKIALWHNGWYDYFGEALKAWAGNTTDALEQAPPIVS
jgi:hypothetical protein